MRTEFQELNSIQFDLIKFHPPLSVTLHLLVTFNQLQTS